MYDNSHDAAKNLFQDSLCDKCSYSSPQRDSNQRSKPKISYSSLKERRSIWTASSTIVFIFFFSTFLVPIDGFCPPKCSCVNATVQCTGTNLATVPFLMDPNTKILNLSSNKIAEISQSLEFYSDVRALDLSGNEISSIEIEDLSAQTKVKVLNLNDNKLKILKNKTLSSMKNLKELYLESNLITSLEPQALDGLTRLQVLKLSKNSLQNLSALTFLSTNNLEIIELNYNRFQTVPSNAINGLSSLKELHLDGNYISRLAPKSFWSLSNLLHLTLNKNNISVIQHKSFEGLQNLVSLSVKDNRLRTVPGQALTLLTKLQVLDLSGNLFQVLGQESFQRAPATIRQLYLTRCPHLTRVESHALLSMTRLEKLDLSHNARLAHLGSSVFSALTNLKDIDLTACGIMFLVSKQMPQGVRTQLHLAGNPLHCNCSLLWLANLPNNSTNHLDSPTCATPSNLYGLKISDVDPRKAGCEHQLSLMAIAVCIGVVILGFLIIGVFLACRWRRSSTTVAKDSNIRYPHPNERTFRELYRDPTSELVPIPTPMFAPKYSLPHHTSNSYPQCLPDNQQCMPGCPTLRSPAPPYAVHPATHPLLTPTSPSPTSQGTHIPVDWLCPNPYEDESLHWYTTIGRDGREYLTGIAGELTFIPPPPPASLPPELPPSPPISIRLQRKPSSLSQPSPRGSKRRITGDSPEKPPIAPLSSHRGLKDRNLYPPDRVPSEPITYI